jgi:ribosomal protein S8
MKINFKTNINKLINAIKKRKTYTLVKNNKENLAFLQLLRENGLISNFYCEPSNQNILVFFKFDFMDNPGISGFVLKTSKKRKQLQFKNNTKRRLETNFIQNITTKKVNQNFSIF